jgi:hypothetical protein
MNRPRTRKSRTETGRPLRLQQQQKARAALAQALGHDRFLIVCCRIEGDKVRLEMHPFDWPQDDFATVARLVAAKA